MLVSLYTGTLMWSALVAATVLTISLTFLLPVVQKPHLSTHHEDVAVDPAGAPPEGEQPPGSPPSRTL